MIMDLVVMNRMADNGGNREPESVIYEIRRRVQAARNRYWREGYDGDVNDCHRELAVAVLQYYDVLHEFRDESVLDPEDFPNISLIRDRVGKKVQQRVSQPGLKRPEKVELVPAMEQVPVEEIVELTEDLDDLAQKLGFGASVSNARPIYHAGKLNTEDYDEPVKDSVQKPQ